MCILSLPYQKMIYKVQSVVQKILEWIHGFSYLQQNINQYFLKFTTYNMPSCLWMNVTIYVNTSYLWNNDVFLGLWECSHPREREEVAGHQKPPRDRWLQRPYPPRHPQQRHPSPLQRGPLPRGRPSVWVTYRTSCLPWMVSNDCSECSWLLFTSCISPKCSSQGELFILNSWT